jgi:hypothetical protein
LPYPKLVEVRVARRHFFQTKNTNLGKFWRVLQGLAMEDFGIFYGHLVYVFYGHFVNFMINWDILQLFGIFFSRFGMYVCMYARKIWQPWLN